MANGKRPPPDSPNARRKRPPTVIELEASEVPSEPATAAPPPDPAAPGEPFIPPPPVTPQQAAAETVSSGPPPPEPPRGEPESPSHRRPPFAFLPDDMPWSYAGAGIAGVAGGLLVALLLWLGGVFAPGRDPSADLSPRLTAIEKQLRDLAARPAPASVDPKALDDMTGRLAKLESAQAAPRAPVTDPVVLGRLNAAESASKSLADNAAALSRRADAADTAVRETGARIESRIEKLAATVTDVQNTARAAAAGSDRASRLAVAASALRNAVEHGDPFLAEIAIVKPLTPDGDAVALLEPFASSGVPRDAALGQELTAIVRPLLRESGEPLRDGGFLDRLQANAQKLVRVRPVDEEPRGDERAAILTRIEQRAAQGNINGVLAELDKLPADARAPFLAWIGKAQARNKALDASRRLAAGAVAALKAAP